MSNDEAAAEAEAVADADAATRCSLSFFSPSFFVYLWRVRYA